MYRIWCECDLGHDDIVFTSVGSAKDWCRKNEALKEVMQGLGAFSIEELNDRLLLGFRKLEVI